MNVKRYRQDALKAGLAFWCLIPPLALVLLLIAVALFREKYAMAIVWSIVEGLGILFLIHHARDRRRSMKVVSWVLAAFFFGGALLGVVGPLLGMPYDFRWAPFFFCLVMGALATFHATHDLTPDALWIPWDPGKRYRADDDAPLYTRSEPSAPRRDPREDPAVSDRVRR